MKGLDNKNPFGDSRCNLLLTTLCIMNSAVGWLERVFTCFPSYLYQYAAIQQL